jgi:uncharacterized protein (DUF362 family)
MTKTTRREFLKQAALTGIAISGIPAAVEAAEQAAIRPKKSRVMIARDTAVFRNNGEVDVKVLQNMLDRSIAKLTGTNSGVEGWKKLFKPDDVVGIKVNCLFGKGASTHPEVAWAVVNGLLSAGVKAENIIIWDRSTGDLVKAGYKPNKDGAGVKCYGDDGNWGELIEQGSFKGRITKIISEKVTAFVNAPILKTHGIAGVSIALKNHYGSFDNPGSHHSNHCNPALADFSAIPVVKKKSRLVVVDALRPQYNGGPGLKVDAQWNYCGLLVGQDPVAIDYQGLSIIQDKRVNVGLKPIEANITAWLQSAQDRGVGVCDPQKIEVIMA